MPSASRDRSGSEQLELPQQVRHRGGLAARNDQCVDRVEFAAATDGDRIGAGFTQRRQVLAGVALQRQHADADGASLARTTFGHSVHSRAGLKSRL